MLQVVGANAALASYNKWVTQAHYGQISFSSMQSNLSGGMVYDADNFAVNQIGHPYQGGLYYSAARHYGHDYYRGAAYTALGSLQWEYLLETEPPAFNDLITTTMGGAMLGEITSRLAHEILDPRARGAEKLFRELSAGLVNPVLGLNRMLDGSAFRAYGPPREPGSRPRLLLRAATGGILRSEAKGAGSDLPGLQKVPKGTTEYLIWYGEEYKVKKPFDFFIVNLGLDFSSDPVSSIYARGLLGSHHLFGDGDDYGMLTWGQNFDYINSGIYKIGASGIGGGYSQRFRWKDRWYHVFQVMVGGIALGGAHTEYFLRGERNYNLGPGAFSTTRIVFGKYGFGHMALNLDRYWIYTVSGARGHELLGLGMFEVSKSLYKSFGSILSYTFYDRTADYADYPAINQLTQEIRLALSFGFN